MTYFQLTVTFNLQMTISTAVWNGAEQIQIKTWITFVPFELFQLKFIFSISKAFPIALWYFQSPKNFFERAELEYFQLQSDMDSAIIFQPTVLDEYSRFLEKNPF